ncbi:hypothetical protein PCIT_a1639 [Pseudoalteromonas citrea]|uniref:Glycosyltransferase subfamily 4-like N-terminal domain-containing protein n=2 Tax=Pseudoalteromonas citrea TaxID=43655 RepID=A0AAD4AMK8_9GAMM|nr:hypothetical protein [Pseudoalteromonas citrea]KAF7775446.1 hypothetical protein PCIT_a1639 [Pseudoalteromonas citrea]
MKFLIVSYYNADDITPRGFRTREVFLALTKSGHEVELISPSKSKSESYNGLTKKEGKIGFKIRIKNLLKYILPGGRDLKWSFVMIPKLVDKKKTYDCTISIGLPFSVHIMVALLKVLGRLNSRVLIADYGDPFSQSNATKFIFSTKIERCVLKAFNKVIIPTPLMLPAFDNLVHRSKIKIVPQTVEHKEYRVDCYKEGSSIKFAYAGVLYPELREPKEFFEYLAKIQMDFMFVVYTDMDNHSSMELFSEYKRLLGSKLSILPLIPREECIFALSGMDFLINFTNKGGVQVPSKLIDYTIAGRPILEVDSGSFSNEIDSFIERDYTLKVKYDISVHSRERFCESIQNICLSEFKV